MNATIERLNEPQPVKNTSVVPHYRMTQGALRLIRASVSKGRIAYVHSMYGMLLDLSVYQWTANAQAIATYAELAESLGVNVNLTRAVLKTLQDLKLIEDKPGISQKDPHIFTIASLDNLELPAGLGLPSAVKRAHLSPDTFLSKLGRKETSVLYPRDEMSDNSTNISLPLSPILYPRDETSHAHTVENDAFCILDTKSPNVLYPKDKIPDAFCILDTKRPPENVDNKPIADPPKNRIKESYLKNLNTTSSDGLEILKEAVRNACLELGFPDNKIVGIVATILNEKQKVKATNEQALDAVTRAKQVQGDFPTQSNPPGLFISNFRLALAGEKIGKQHHDTMPKSKAFEIMPTVGEDGRADYGWTPPVIDEPVDLPTERAHVDDERNATEEEQKLFLAGKDRVRTLPRMAGQMYLVRRIKLVGVSGDGGTWAVQGTNLERLSDEAKSWLDRMESWVCETSGAKIAFRLV